MNCPTCNVSLLISERQGIEIDYCQQCRGVWLDRGELDKLIERAGQEMPSPSFSKRESDDDDMPRDSRHGYGFGHGKRRERENPIGELFDFF